MKSPDDEAVAQLREELSSLLRRLDELGLYQAGAHVWMAVHSLGLPAPPSGDSGRGEDPR